MIKLSNWEWSTLTAGLALAHINTKTREIPGTRQKPDSPLWDSSQISFTQNGTYGSFLNFCFQTRNSIKMLDCGKSQNHKDRKYATFVVNKLANTARPVPDTAMKASRQRDILRLKSNLLWAENQTSIPRVTLCSCMCINKIVLNHGFFLCYKYGFTL